MRVRWYRSPIEPQVLRRLMQRSDLQGWLQVLGNLALFVATATLTYYLFLQQAWIGFALALYVHCTFGGFLSAACHELDHGTVFKNKPLNRVLLRIYALLAWFNFHDYALSHTYHHRYTLHPDGDREVVLPQSPTLRWLYVLQLLTINSAACHELDHGTVFKNKPLNRVLLRIYALLAWFNFHDYALSHTYHHRYTLHPDGDRGSAAAVTDAALALS